MWHSIGNLCVTKYLMDFIVSFPSGASGRFITSIITWLLYDIQTVITYHTYNSAHNLGHESMSWTSDKNVSDLLDSRVYQTLEFTGNMPHRIFWTHAYPDFDIIQQRIPNTKVILITYTDDDVYEISINSKYKNELEHIHEIDKSFKHKDNLGNNNVLVIPYRDIFTTNILDTISKFVGIEPNTATKQNFNNYIEGQRKFLVDINTQK